MKIINLINSCPQDNNWGEVKNIAGKDKNPATRK
jgi:hypothetical protein